MLQFRDLYFDSCIAAYIIVYFIVCIQVAFWPFLSCQLYCYYNYYVYILQYANDNGTIKHCKMLIITKASEKNTCDYVALHKYLS